jgi:hypothetical protein
MSLAYFPSALVDGGTSKSDFQAACCLGRAPAAKNSPAGAMISAPIQPYIRKWMIFLGSVCLVEGDFFLPKIDTNAALSNYHYSLRGYTLKSISRGITIAIASAGARRRENVFKYNVNQCLPRGIESFQLQKR